MSCLLHPVEVMRFLGLVPAALQEGRQLHIHVAFQILLDGNIVQCKCLFLCP